jgi:hypothetical protein
LLCGRPDDSDTCDLCLCRLGKAVRKLTDEVTNSANRPGRTTKSLFCGCFMRKLEQVSTERERMRNLHSVRTFHGFQLPDTVAASCSQRVTKGYAGQDTDTYHPGVVWSCDNWRKSHRHWHVCCHICLNRNITPRQLPPAVEQSAQDVSCWSLV